MKCFYHPERDAVGLCSQCGKAACQDCMKEVESGILCKGCIARRVKAVEAESRVVAEDRRVTAEKARKRLRTSKVVFGVFFFFGMIIVAVSVVQTLMSGGSRLPSLVPLAIGGLLGAVLVGYYAWSFYWGVPAVWQFVRRMFKGMGCFLVLNPVTWLIVGLFFFMTLVFVGEFYCIFGGGWSQYRKHVKLASE